MTLMKLFLIVLFVYIYFRKPAGIPPGSVFTMPVLGDLPQLAAAKGDTIGMLRKLRKKYGNIYSLYMGRQLAIVVIGYSMIYTVAAERGLQFCSRPQNDTNKIIAKGRGIVLQKEMHGSNKDYLQVRHFLSLV